MTRQEAMDTRTGRAIVAAYAISGAAGLVALALLIAKLFFPSVPFHPLFIIIPAAIMIATKFVGASYLKRRTRKD